MNAHCRGCKYFHCAGHQKGSPLAAKYNSWCTKVGNTVAKAVGHCKNKSLKDTTP